jgi:hypothetical protein
MSSDSQLSCPHDRRPGTTVCLHCRHAERVAARERRARFFGQLLLGGVTLTVLGAGGVAGATALNERRTAAARQPYVSPITVQPAVAIAPPPAIPAIPSSVDSGATPALSDSSVTAAPDSTPPLAPIVAEGRSKLADDLFAVRTGDTVRVYFDAAVFRTRRSDKFERLLRNTLPAIYGVEVDSLLTKVPAGHLVSSKELFSEMPRRGLRVPLAAGWTLAIWPETRPGRDGRLIVSYRTTIAPVP